MANNWLIHKIFGELDLHKPSLGRPDVPDLWEKLLADKRPVEKRQLVCGYCLSERDEQVPMYVWQRDDGMKIGVHQYGDAERRHTEPESDEHKAYKERVFRVATEAGFTATTEAFSEDLSIRSDVLISGSAGPIGWEVQRSRARASAIGRRDANALRNGVTAAWHTDLLSLAKRNEVAWLRTDNLPPQAIARRGYIAMGGVTRLRWERCDSRRATPCPARGRGRCGQLHPEPEPDRADLDHVVRSIAGCGIVRITLKGAQRNRKLWVPADDRERCADAGLLIPDQPKPAQRPAKDGKASRRDPTCAPGRMPVVTLPSSTPYLDWRSPKHFARQPGPCRICGKTAHLLDEDGRHCHKACAEVELGDRRFPRRGESS